MSLYAALSELVGSAALACAPVCDLALPDAAIEDRAGFVAWVAGRNEMRDIRAIIEAIGRDVWVGAETRGLAQHDLDQHIRVAAAMCSRLRPSAGLMAEIAAATRAQTPPAGYAGEPIARRMAIDIVSRARAGGALQGYESNVPLREDVILFLLDRVFARLTDHDRRLMRLGPALAEFADEIRKGAGTSERAQPQELAALGISRIFAAQIEAAGGPGFLAGLSSRHGLSDGCLRRIIALVDGQAGDTEGRIARLESLAEWLGEVRDQLMRPANDDAEIRRLKAAAAAALAGGEFEAAMEALRLVRRELREARRRTEERLHEEASALRAHMAEEARATSRLAELLGARGEHAQAAELFAEAAMALPRADRDAALVFNLRRASALLKHARERSDGPALNEALASYATLVRQVAETANAKMLADACLGHGDALLLAGERDPGASRLKDAIAIYQKAIQLFERERDQSGLRRARFCLAKAMVRQGERDNSLEMLKDAAQAFRDAAAATSPEKMPSEYVSVHMNLGAVLLAIEERDGAKASLIEAADAYRKAIGKLDSELDDERWSEAQMNLGLALLGLGEQEGSAQRLGEAVASFREVLESTPRVKWPRRWALTQMNLGNALAAIGERDEKDGAAFIEDAIAAYNMALEELLREAEPLKWAITQMNLGTALIRLGERKDRRRHWLTAAAAMVPALEVFEQLQADDLAEVTRRNLRRLQESWDSFLAPPNSSEAAPAPKPLPAKPRLAQAG